MRISITRGLCACAVLAAGVHSARATLLSYEGFNYAIGAEIGGQTGGTGWLTTGGMAGNGGWYDWGEKA